MRGFSGECHVITHAVTRRVAMSRRCCDTVSVGAGNQHENRKANLTRAAHPTTRRKTRKTSGAYFCASHWARMSNHDGSLASSWELHPCSASGGSPTGPSLSAEFDVFSIQLHELWHQPLGGRISIYQLFGCSLGY